MNVSEQIENRIKELNDWRGKDMARLRKLINDAAPDLVEEWKWDTPVWSNNGNVVALGAFKDHLRINFFKGAALKDPDGLFNAGLEAKTSRGIDLYEGDKVDEAALKDLIRAASALNAKPTKTSKTSSKK
ncbi:MAG TPA: DUF1801 domain-containing protein [Anaerolineales bacterium]|nr:DUF1801 domain-containing protein [Anaerolineales bacterium]